MLSIKLKRIGKKHQASYRLVVSERREKLAGPPTEDLGWYNPTSKKSEFKAERIKYWLSVGAKLSDTVHNILVSQKVIEGKKIAVHKQKKVDPNAKPATPASVQAPASGGQAGAGKPATESAAEAVVTEAASQA